MIESYNTIELGMNCPSIQIHNIWSLFHINTVQIKNNKEKNDLIMKLKQSSFVPNIILNTAIISRQVYFYIPASTFLYHFYCCFNYKLSKIDILHFKHDDMWAKYFLLSNNNKKILISFLEGIFNSIWTDNERRPLWVGSFVRKTK